MVRQYITEEHIQRARQQTPIHWSSIARDTYLRTYSRVKPNGEREDWYETCARVVNGNCSFVEERFIEPNEPERLYQMMLEMKLIPAGRHLWVTGALTDKVFLANCHCADFTPVFSEHFEYTFSRLMEGGGVGANYSDRYVHSRQGNKPWVVQRYVRVHLLLRSDHADIDRPMLLEPGDEAIPHEWDDQQNRYTTLRLLRSEKYSEHWSGNGFRLHAQNASGIVQQVHQLLSTLKSVQDPYLYLQVEDSREGWAQALVALLEAAVFPSGPRELDIVYDLNLIREFGAPLRTFGGTASGPGALGLMLMRIGHLLQQRIDQNLSGLDAMTIDHYIACCVVSGGARRSARMAMKYWQDPDIFEFIRIKRPVTLPNGKEFYPHHTTNISVVVDNKFLRAVRKGNPHALQVLDEVVDGMLNGRGEPGFINASKCLEGEAPGTEFYSTNPCVTGDTLILTDHGISAAANLTELPFRVVVEGELYPCSGFFSTGTKPVYEIVTEEGSRLEATADHRLLVSQDSGEEWKTTLNLQRGDQVIIQGTLAEHTLQHISGLLELLEHLGSECEDGTHFVWIPEESVQTAHQWKAILNLLGIRSTLSYRKSISSWSLRIDRSEMKRLTQALRTRRLHKKCKPHTARWTETVAAVRYIGDKPVYDCSVEKIHCYLSNGFVSHNCGEIGFVRYPDMYAFDVCNLGHVNLARVQDDTEMEEAFRLMTRFLIRATFAPQADEKMRRSIERNRRIGVGFLGYHTWLALHGIRYSQAPESEFVRTRLKRWYQVVREEARRYCLQLRIPECIKVTAIAPTGTVGTVADVSTGIQPVFAPFYRRRIIYNANDQKIARRKALECLLHLYALDDQQRAELRQAILDLKQQGQLHLQSLVERIPHEEAARAVWERVSESPASLEELVDLAQHRPLLEISLEEDRPYIALFLEPHPTRENHYVASYLVMDSTASLVIDRLLRNGECASLEEAQRIVQELVESQYDLQPRHFMANQKMAQELFADNCISITINVDTKKVTAEELKAQLLEYLPYLKGVTVMPPYEGDDAPLQAISFEEFQRLKGLGVPVSVGAEQAECATGACPVQ